MTAKARSIEIPPESETAKLPREADDMLRADYDPQRTIDGTMAAAGSISEEEGERWIEDIYRWRREGSRPVEPPE